MKDTLSISAAAARLRRPVIAGAALLVLTTAFPAAAADAVPPPEWRDKLKGGLDRLDLVLRSMKGWIDGLPSYAAPELLPNGDILIRRLPPTPEPAPVPPAAPDGKSDGGAPDGRTRL